MNAIASGSDVPWPDLLTLLLNVRCILAVFVIKQSVKILFWLLNSIWYMIWILFLIKCLVTYLDS